MLELRRQIFHVILGVGLVTLLNFNFINIIELFFILIFGVVISFLSKKFKIPVIEWFLKNFDRENSKIRGQGVLTCFLGALIVLLFFEKNVALASVIILTLGDSFCHLGKYGRWKLPFNDFKFVEGLLIGIVIASVGAAIFVPFWKGLIGASVAMVVESFDLKIRGKEIDDNILIPLVAGMVISLI